MADEVEDGGGLFRATMEAAQVGIFVLQDGHFRYVNPCLSAMLGYAAGELVAGLGPFDVVSAAQHEMVRTKLGERLAGLTGSAYELEMVRKDGSRFPATITGMPSELGGVAVSVGTVVDISEQKAAELRIRELADFDALTGLPNRRLLRDRVEQMIAAAERDGSSAALMFVDLDHFKRVNDSLGHSVGDELLCAVAQRYSTVVRKVDTLARLGGGRIRHPVARGVDGHRGRGGAPCTRYLRCAVRRGRPCADPDAVDWHRALSAGWRGYRLAAEKCRFGDVQGQGTGAQHFPVLRLGHEHGDARAPDDGEQPAPGA